MFPVAVFLSLWASPHALIYEWALLVAAAVVLWERFPASPRRVAVPVRAGVGRAGGQHAARAGADQDLDLPVAVQVSVPVLGVVGWLAARELARRGHRRRSA